MLQLIIKSLISGVLIAIVSETAKRAPAQAALIASLPLVSVIAMIWLWRDTGDVQRLATHAEATFWMVIPSLPMFLVLPWLLRRGVPFWPSLIGVCVMTAGLYALTVLAVRPFGIRL